MKFHDVFHTLEELGMRVHHYTPTEDTVYITADIRRIVDSLRLTHTLKLVDWTSYVGRESAIVVFSTGHVASLRRAKGSPDTYIRVWQGMWNASEFGTIQDITEPQKL